MPLIAVPDASHGAHAYARGTHLARALDLPRTPSRRNQAPPFLESIEDRPGQERKEDQDDEGAEVGVPSPKPHEGVSEDDQSVTKKSIIGTSPEEAAND